MGKPVILYDNRLADATPVASTTATGDFAAINLADFRPYTWWKPTALPATVTVDCGSAKAADLLTVFGHDLFTQGATLQVRGSTDNFAASDVLVGTITPTDNNPFLISFGSVSYRYWRLRITGTTMPSIACAILGARITLPTFLPQGFDPVGRKAEGQRNRSESGQPLGRVVTHETWKGKIRMQKVTWSWVRATWLPAWQAHLRSSPFAFAWDPDNYPAEIRLVTADEDFSTPHQAGSWADLDVDIMGIA